MDNPVPYKKISGRAGSAIAHHRMWMAPDHLLVVKQIGCSEEFKRFYFSDIQAVVIMRSPRYALWALVLPVIALFLIGFIFSVDHPGFLQGLLGATLVFWVVHLAKGPTCTCWIQTGINKEKLPMFGRVRAANKFWLRIERELLEVQGRFDLDAMEAEGTRPVVDPKKAPPPVPPVPQAEVA
ncbi:hypothetical protein [Pontiella sp.]|uniref:hypothetical protein n=1 Tax=Pontiella sp. TaxID=2837462 RepID=UPI0035646FA7